MPKVTVYVRETDYTKWQSVEKKTEFISQALNGVSIPPSGAIPPIKSIKVLVDSPCPHGSDPRLCKFAKYDKTRKEKWCK